MKYKLSKTIPQPETPYAVDASPDGRWVAVTCFDQKLRLYDTASFAERKAIHLGTSFPHACGFAADSSQVIGGGKAMVFFDLGKFKRGLSLKGHRDEIFRVAIAPDGRHALTSSGANVVGADCSVRWWDLPLGKERSRWKLGSSVFGLALSVDGTVCAACTQDGEVVGGAPGAKAPAWKAGWDSWLYGAAITPEGDELWLGGDSPELGVLSTRGGKLLRTMPTRMSTRQLLFLPGGKHLLLGLQVYQGPHRGHLALLDRKGATVWASKPIARMVHGVAVSPDASRLYAITSDPNTFVVFEPA